MYTESKTLNRFVVFIVKDNKMIDYSSLVEDRYLTRVVHTMSYDSNIRSNYPTIVDSRGTLVLEYRFISPPVRLLHITLFNLKYVFQKLVSTSEKEPR